MATLGIFKVQWGKKYHCTKITIFFVLYTINTHKKNIVLKIKRAQKVKKTKDIFTLYWIALVPTRKPHKIGLYLFTHRIGDFGVISVTQWSCTYCSLESTLSHIKVACVASVSVWFRSKERPRNRIFGLAMQEIKREPKNERRGRGRPNILLVNYDGIKCRCTNSGVTGQVGGF